MEKLFFPLIPLITETLIQRLSRVRAVDENPLFLMFLVTFLTLLVLTFLSSLLLIGTGVLRANKVCLGGPIKFRRNREFKLWFRWRVRIAKLLLNVF